VAGTLAGGAALATGVSASLAMAGPLRRQEPSDDRRLFKTLKIGMVQGGNSLTDKFRMARDAGFDGIELDSPGMDVAEARAAMEATGLVVDGTVCSTHWQVRHTSADAATRDQALRDLQTALRDTHAVGGHTALLVAGHGDDGPEAEIWPRAIDNIAKAIPLAAQLGVVIAIENVWNHFLYDHDGGDDQTADKFVRFVDELNSPWVGMQFDIGNHWKYGSPGDWIRTLGKRVVKLDIKGYSRARQNWSEIGEGDIDWADVRAALKEIGFAGWVAAEVNGGDAAWLATVAGQIDRVLDLKPGPGE
jgi:hexulose-6-phosphate isomerase